MYPHEGQMYQFPSALADMILGLSPSRQYGHRGSGISVAPTVKVPVSIASVPPQRRLCRVVYGV
jgi:hypothetical protein